MPNSSVHIVSLFFHMIDRAFGRVRRLLCPTTMLLDFALVCLVLGACSRQPAAHQYKSTPVEGWESIDTLRFHIDSLAHAGTYNLKIGVRTSSATPFPFCNLYLLVKQHWFGVDNMVETSSAFLHERNSVATRTSMTPADCSPRTVVEVCDTFVCHLTDEEGDITGTGISIYQYLLPFKSLQLPQGAEADITINHIMRRRIIPGITDVGILLERVD